MIKFDSEIIGVINFENKIYVGLLDGSIYTIHSSKPKLFQTLDSPISLFSKFKRSQKEEFLLVCTSDSNVRIFSDKVVCSFVVKSPVTASTSYDVDNDGFFEVFFCHEDGYCSLYSLTFFDNPTIISSTFVGFVVTNILAGEIYSAGLCSAVVTSLAGYLGLVSAEVKNDRSLLGSKSL